MQSWFFSSTSNRIASKLKAVSEMFIHCLSSSKSKIECESDEISKSCFRHSSFQNFGFIWVFILIRIIQMAYDPNDF